MNYSSVLFSVFNTRDEARLTVEEEREALALAQAGDENAKLRVILAYAAALRSGVTQYARAVAGSPTRVEPEDARQEVVLGLLEAIENFDPERHERLAAIVSGYIAKAITRLAPTASGFSIPARTLTRFFGILRKANGDAAEGERLAPDNAMTAETFRAVLDAVRNVSALEAVQDDGRGEFTGNGQEVQFRPISGDSADDVEDRVLVEAAFSSVDGLEEEVVRLAYGFADFDPLGDEEVGERLGFSRAKSQRTRSSALGKMRVALGVA